ncbi:MAG: LppP/LprE family lipoprotein [Acidimicrobiales bacterium]
MTRPRKVLFVLGWVSLALGIVAFALESSNHDTCTSLRGLIAQDEHPHLHATCQIEQTIYYVGLPLIIVGVVLICTVLIREYIGRRSQIQTGARKEDGFDLAAGVRVVEGFGYAVEGQNSQDGADPLAVLIGTAASTWRNAFFFARNTYIGTDFSSPVKEVSLAWVDGDTAALEYPKEPDASLEVLETRQVVRFRWTGDKLVRLDPLPAYLLRLS